MATFEGLCWFDGVYTYISGCPLRLYQKFGQFCGGRVPVLPKNVGANHRVTCVLSTCGKRIKKNIRIVQVTSTMWKLLRRCRVLPMIYPCGKSYPTGHFMNQLCWLEGGRLFLFFHSFLYRTASNRNPNPQPFSMNRHGGQLHLCRGIVADLKIEYHHWKNLQGYQ